MEKEFYGKFIDKNNDEVQRSDCKIVLEDDKISLYSCNDGNIKFREFKADCIFSYEEERLIKISKKVSLLPEILWAFFGALALPFNFWIGILITGVSFLRVMSKPSKSYILLCKPISKPVQTLKLLKVCGIKTQSGKKIVRAA